MAKFSRAHYVILASALNATYEAYADRDKRHAVLQAADSISAALAKDNPAFAWDHFIKVVKGDADPNSRPPAKGRSVVYEPEHSAEQCGGTCDYHRNIAKYVRHRG